MCRYNKLHQGKYGYVIECRQCSHIQVAFGTSCMTLTRKQYDELTDAVIALDKQQRYYEFAGQKSIIVPTACHNMNIICSHTELKQLKHLLLDGRNSLQMAKLFVFHEN